MSHTPTEKPLRIVLAGRQNAGKTSLLMHLTGTPQHPVNFPGSSVERIESAAEFFGTPVICVDLPGIGSLDPLSPDERLAVDYLKSATHESEPLVLCAVLDATKLGIELHLLRQLAQLRLPLVVALTKVDTARAEGLTISAEALGARLGCPVVAVDGLRGHGLDTLRRALVDTRLPPSPALAGLDTKAVVSAVTSKAQAASSPTDRLDSVLLHRVLGLPIAMLVVFATFQAIFTGSEPFIGWIEAGQGWLAGLAEAAVPPGALQSFLVAGLIGGVGSVLVFLPQIVLLMAIITLLESTGYMARVAFLLDRALHRLGLSGRSFVPLVSSFACAIPGILSTRIIENERDRLATIAVAPLMSCSARLPVYVVLIAAFFPSSMAGAVLFGLYVLGIALAALVAWLLRKTVLAGGESPLLMELPTYQPPSWRVVFSQVRSAATSFITMAGTVIFLSTIVIWLASYYPRPEAIHKSYEVERAALNESNVDEATREAELRSIDARESAEYLEQSALARVGRALQPIFAPAGFDWRVTVGILSAFPAREVIVPTFGVLTSLGEVDAGGYDLAFIGAEADEQGLRDKLRSLRDENGDPVLNPTRALALMVFFALCSQCVSTLGAIRRETRSWRWPVFVFCYMTALAWIAAVAVNQLGPRFLPAGAPTPEAAAAPGEGTAIGG